MRDQVTKTTTSSLLKASEVAQAVAAKEETHSLRPAAWMIVVVIGLSVVNTFVLGMVDVIAVSGFVEQVGTQNLPWLWVVEMLFSLLISGGYLRLIDRLPRARTMKLLLGFLSVIYILLSVLMWFGIASKILPPIIYLLYAQQVLVFPLVFWGVAGDLYPGARGQKIFPILASGEVIGRILGYAVFSLPELLGLTALAEKIDTRPELLLMVSAGLLIFSLVIAQFALKEHQAPTPRKSDEDASVWENIKAGSLIIRQVPMLRYLFMLVTLTWIGMTLLWFNFYEILDNTSDQTGQFQKYYSLFSIGTLLATLLLQWIGTSYMLRRLSLKNAFAGLPIILLACLTLAAILSTGLVGGVLAIFLPVVIYNAWDVPVFQTLLNLIPADRRGRVNALLSNYTYAFGTILGSLVLLGATRLMAGFSQIGYLITGILAMAIAIWAALNVHATYEDSLLAWQLARRPRAGDVLDKLEE